MKKLLLVLLMCYAALLTQAALIDDFESYDVGNIVGQDPMPWVETAAGEMNIQGNTWSKYMWGSDGYLNFTGDFAGFVIPNTDTETTLFFRTMAATADEDTAFGLDDTLSPDTWDNEFYIQWNDGDLQARNNTGGQPIVSGAETGVWYNVWFVINNAADRYDIYVNTGTADATVSDLAGDDWLPRGGTAGDLVALQFEANGPIGIDDLHMWSGTVLTNPPLPVIPPEEEPITGLITGAELPVVNPGFTLPGYASVGFTDVPGWYSFATSWSGDTGTRDNDNADGDGWHLSEFCPDGPYYNITSTQMVEGEVYGFTAQCRTRWNGTGVEMSVVAGDPNISLVTKFTPLTHDAGWLPASVSYTATAADAGKYIGVKFEGTGDPLDNSWLRTDDVHLYSGYEEIHGPIDPDPGDGSIDVVPRTITLSWTPSNDPNVTGQNLYYYIGSESTFNIGAYNAVSPVTPDTDGSHSIGSVELDQYVLWRVDTIIDANALTGPTWHFVMQTTDYSPNVDAGSSYITWLGNMPQTLAGTVDDLGEGDVDDADVLWSIESYPWEPVDNRAMQMLDRGAGDPDLIPLEEAGYDPNLLQEWIGTDNRGLIGDPMVLTLSGVPAGAYTWTSTHHDIDDQAGRFDVTVVDAAGSGTTDDVTFLNFGNLPVTEFTTTITSDGSDIKVIFDAESDFFLMNGFVLSDGVNPDLKVDFQTTDVANPVSGGWHAYTANHEVAASFTAQDFAALGTTVTVLPEWGAIAAGWNPYATVTKTSSDPLNPTADFDTNYAADYTIVLTATDTGGSMGAQSDSDTLTVRVAEDACAAKQLETAGYNPADFDQNCVVDINDFAALAGAWLEDINLTAAVAY